MFPPHGNSLATKGRLSPTYVIGTRGVIPVIPIGVTLPLPNYCDYPHAVKMATKGRLGATVGTVSRGTILKVCIEEIQEVPPTGGAGIRGLREEDKKKKIIVTVEAYGKKFTHEQIVSFDHKIRVKDLEIIDNGEEIVSIMISDVTKK